MWIMVSPAISGLRREYEAIKQLGQLMHHVECILTHCGSLHFTCPSGTSHCRAAYSLQSLAVAWVALATRGRSFQLMDHLLFFTSKILSFLQQVLNMLLPLGNLKPNCSKVISPNEKQAGRQCQLQYRRYRFEVSEISL